jgi:AraC-like DNA-binding protein
MQTLQKADGFEAQKLLVVPDTLLIDIARHPLIKPLSITDIGFFPHAQYHYRERSEGCTALIVIYCIEGEGWLQIGQQEIIPVHKNTLFLIPPNTQHRYGASMQNPWSIYWFHLSGTTAQQFWEYRTSNNLLHAVPANQAAKIINIFEESYEILLCKGYSLKHYIYVSQLMNYLLGIITLIQDETSDDRHKNEYIEQSIQYMIDHVQSTLTLDELAEHINLSKPHFIHLFKQVTGYSPISYYLRLKIQRSCLYLYLTDDSIKEVSQRVGIQDPYYFSRMFHKIVGQSPSEFRTSKKN